MTVAKKENIGGGIAPVSGMAKSDIIANAKEKHMRAHQSVKWINWPMAASSNITGKIRIRLL
jgi:hypothetical protein